MKSDNICMFRETMEIARSSHYHYDGKAVSLKLNAEQMAQVEAFSPERIQEVFWQIDPCGGSVLLMWRNLTVRVSESDSFEAALRLSGDRLSAPKPSERVLVLNFANPVTPGGGVLRGARAQEEDLCRKSTLYCSLTNKDAEVMYQYNAFLKNYLASDYMLLSPHVEIIRDKEGRLLSDTCLVSVLTAAAPMVIYGTGGLSQDELQELLAKRIHAIFTVAAYKGYQKLVLGAWGCGAFGNDPELVASLFANEIEYWSTSGMSPFRQIEFAILKGSGRNSWNYECFARQFSGSFA